jgi:hypothetical protein
MRLLFIFLTLVSICFSQVITPDEVLFVQWDNDSTSIKYRTAPDGRYGPRSFRVKNDSILILDPISESIKIFYNNNFKREIVAPARSEDFVLLPGNEYFFLVDNSIVKFKNSHLINIYTNEKSLPLVKGLLADNNNLYLQYHNGTTSQLLGNRLVSKSLYGIKQFDKFYEAEKISRNFGLIKIRNASNNIISTINLRIPSGNLATINLIGCDNKDRIYLNIELIEREIPLKVKREMWIINLRGDIIGRINIPNHYFVSVNRDIELTPDGTLYHLISSVDGVHIFKWSFSDSLLVPFEGVYPEKFQRNLHYNELQPSDFQGGILNKPTDYPIVTRSEALSIGASYVEHEWSCTEENLTNGVEEAPDGDLVETPHWIEPGTNFKIPYKWGGFNTLSEYDDGMLDGKYAGDIHTDGVSSYARGVDCSGFVSRCWKLPVHYSTYMMDDEITIAYSSWEELKPGDAIHKEGHVRLAINNDPSGNILVVEASGKDWRVNYHLYSYSKLYNYTPRYYINMQGPSIPLAQPVLQYINNFDSTCIFWSLASTENVDGILVQGSVNGEDWAPVFPDSLISAECSYVALTLPDDYPCFFKVVSVNISDDTSESLPSDTYGIFTSINNPEKILIIDGFDRTESSGSWHLLYHPFASWMGKVLFELGIPFETATNESVVSEMVNLASYKAVFWILGDESTHDETFSSEEQEIVKSFLQNGGYLFLSGSEVAWDLDKEGSSQDKSFFSSYLKADYVADDSEIYSLDGINGSIFHGLLFEFDDGSQGIYEEDYPDVINPSNGSTACLKYSSSSLYAGVQYEGVFPDGKNSGKLVYISFPWETITDQVSKKEVIERILTFFDFQYEEITPYLSHLPDSPVLSRGYPNPFNDFVKFNLKLNGNNLYKVSIYNSLGQLIKSYRPGTEPNPNIESIDLTWNGENEMGEKVSSGVYLFTVRVKNHILVERISYLK